MKLTFQRTYKSIRPFEAFELPDFVVLTGVNGAGKSHLLEAIENGAIQIDEIQLSPPGHGPRVIRRYDANNLAAQDTGPFSSGHMMQEIGSHWDHFNQIAQAHIPNYLPTCRSVLGSNGGDLTLSDFWEMDEATMLEMGFEASNIPRLLQHFKTTLQSYELSVSNDFNASDSINRPRILAQIIAKVEKPLLAMSREEFFENFPTNWQQVDLFQHSFSRLFSNYQQSWRANELRRLGREQGENLTFLNKDEFLEIHGEPPWDFLNSLLEIANFDFRINHPERYQDLPYEPVLTDQKRGIVVKFADLSSGERILMSFALSLYHVKDSRAILDYPKVLLFDEIDAPLHPSMTKSLLDTIHQALVKEKGIKVILTTHSPSTVALSPEEAIFVMQKEGPKRVRAVSRDAALGILTAGVPTLSVNFENRRQVFVESTYDVKFYGTLFQLSKSMLQPEISIDFIGSGGGGGMVAAIRLLQLQHV